VQDGTERPAPRNRATKWTARLGLAGVTVLAAWASYLHALIVVRAADGRTMVAAFIPAVADLLIAAASANLLDASRRGDRWPRVSVVAIVVAIGVTITFNVAAGSPRAVPPWLVNVWPPVAFILALESFMGHVRRGRGGAFPEVHGAAPVTPALPVAVPGQPPADWLDVQIRAHRTRMSVRATAEAFGVSRGRVQSAERRAALAATENVPAGDGAGPAPAAPAGALNGQVSHG